MFPESNIVILLQPVTRRIYDSHIICPFGKIPTIYGLNKTEPGTAPVLPCPTPIGTCTGLRLIHVRSVQWRCTWISRGLSMTVKAILIDSFTTWHKLFSHLVACNWSTPLGGQLHRPIVKKTVSAKKAVTQNAEKNPAVSAITPAMTGSIPIPR